MQHGGGELADRGKDRPVQIRCAELDAEQAEIGERVLQQGIVALESLGQHFLPGDGGRELGDRRPALAEAGPGRVQSIERRVQRLVFPHEGIVVVQQAGPGAQHIAMQRAFRQSEIIERGDGLSGELGVGIHALQQQPGEEEEQQRHRRHGGCELHGDVRIADGGAGIGVTLRFVAAADTTAVTGAPR